MVDSYIICSTPRTGSTLLCGLLQSTGVAGYPESYFRKPDEPKYASDWEIAQGTKGVFSYEDFLDAARNVGSSKNGVFAVRIMWGSMEDLVSILRNIKGEDGGKDADLLRSTFGSTRYVYLSRADVLAQAVSWTRAEQTDIWHWNG